ncbi:hypothetical protein JCM21900_004644 [Sporobolomyces salmonicolor]
MRFPAFFCWSILALGSVGAQSSSTDGSNLETFPTVGDSSTAGSATLSLLPVFNLSSLQTGHGPAVSPTAARRTSLSSSSATASGPWTTLVSASSGGGNRSLSQSVVTSTVDGSVTTVTVTNSAVNAAKTSAGRSCRSRGRGEELGMALAAGLGAVVLLGAAW